ncbi:hypothetical protein ACOMHN_018488 [Nucella lapillus]
MIRTLMISVEFSVAGPTRDWSEVNTVSTTNTHQDTEEWNPSATVIKSELDRQTHRGQVIQAEPVDQSVTWDGCCQFQSVDSKEDQVNMKGESSTGGYLYAKAVDFCSDVIKTEPATTDNSSVVIKTEPVTTDISSDVIKTEPVTTYISSDVIKTEPATTDISSDVIKTEPATTNISSDVITSQHNSANTSGSGMSLNRSHMCQQCSKNFASFSTLKLHEALVHGPTRDWSEVNTVSTANTHQDTEEWNPSATVMKSEADRQTHRGQVIQAERQFQSVDSKEEQVDMKGESCTGGYLYAKAVDFCSDVIKTEPATTDIGSDVITTRHNSANISGSLLSLNRSHMGQQRSGNFVRFNGLKLHEAFVHDEKVHTSFVRGDEEDTDLPVFFTPGSSSVGNYGDMNMEK